MGFFYEKSNAILFETSDLIANKMENINLIVFDKTRGYARLVKYYFGITCDIQVWKGNKNDFFDEKRLNICFLIITCQEDLMSISYFATKADMVFYAITFKNFKPIESFNHKDSFVYIDMQMVKANLVSEIKDRIILHLEKQVS